VCSFKLRSFINTSAQTAEDGLWRDKRSRCLPLSILSSVCRCYRAQQNKSSSLTEQRTREALSQFKPVANRKRFRKILLALEVTDMEVVTLVLPSVTGWDGKEQRRSLLKDKRSWQSGQPNTTFVE
jgi:hypothetical protein